MSAVAKRGASIDRAEDRGVYLRFVVPWRDDWSGRRQGVFATAYRIRGSGELPLAHHHELTDALGWLDTRLAVPRRFTRGRRGHARGTAICWAKAEATKVVASLRRVAWVLRDHGVPTEVIATARPGYVVYEDPHQVAAVPFADTPT
ncbi:MAG: hypothetical protein ACRCT8_05485 [Lacipirellulaceae bacterium]